MHISSLHTHNISTDIDPYFRSQKVVSVFLNTRQVIHYTQITSLNSKILVFRMS